VRRRRSVALLTALPFLAVYEATSLQIHTRIESDGTGLRQVVVTAAPDRRKAVASHVGKLDPGAPWVTREDGVSAEKYRLTRDARFTSPRPFDQLTVTTGARFGVWPLAATTYTYTDKITRCDFTAEPKEAQGAAATEFEYSVTMPGAVDEGSASPAGGSVQGHTVTWRLKADKDTQEVTVRSAQPDWGFTLVVAYVVLALVALALRLALAQRRAKPRRI